MTSACQSAAATLAPASTPTGTPLPAPEPVTVTPSLIPTQAFSPTPPPRFFTEEFDNDLSAWTSFQTNDDSAPPPGLENGWLIFNIPTPYTWIYSVYNAQTYQGTRIDASFEARGAQPQSIGLICNYSETGGWYEFNISTDGAYNILYGQWLAQRLAQYTPIVNDTSEYLKPGETKYELGLGCTENTLWLYINEKLFRKLDVKRFGINEGKVGIAVSSFENPHVVVGFDWVKISEP